tara:strand:- start:840 stop:944 length:105 start_codon:yes stop_codon:yes gene_type:complete
VVVEQWVQLVREMLQEELEQVVIDHLSQEDKKLF